MCRPFSCQRRRILSAVVGEGDRVLTEAHLEPLEDVSALRGYRLALADAERGQHALHGVLPGALAADVLLGHLKGEHLELVPAEGLLLDRAGGEALTPGGSLLRAVVQQQIEHLGRQGQPRVHAAERAQVRARELAPEDALGLGEKLRDVRIVLGELRDVPRREFRPLLLGEGGPVRRGQGRAAVGEEPQAAQLLLGRVDLAARTAELARGGLGLKAAAAEDIEV